MLLINYLFKTSISKATPHCERHPAVAQQKGAALPSAPRMKAVKEL
jgi:hypothetical protein